MKIIIRILPIILLSFLSITTFAAVDYSASYKLIARQNNKEIGYYRVSITKLENTHQYQQKGEIFFTYPQWFKNIVYHYKDTVIFDEQQGVISLDIDIQDKTNLKISGQRSLDGNQLILRKFSPENNKLLEEKIVKRNEYDLTLFAFRIPSPCDNKAIHSQYRAKILDVVNWRIDLFTSTHIPVEERAAYTPTISWPTMANACLFFVKTSAKTGDRMSWISPEGYLIYETTPLYNMILDEENSVLPITSLEIEK